MRRRFSILVLTLATLAATACTIPTAPSARSAPRVTHDQVDPNASTGATGGSVTGSSI